jgi:hypothetical protein
MRSKLPRLFFQDSTYTFFIVSIFLSLSIIGLLNHEMWGDELESWLLAKDSPSIVNLISNMRYTGHPGLWHVCLYFLSKLSPNPVIMQGFHLLLATSVIFIFVRYSPFTKFEKLLFSFGYFPFYEYSILSRNYSIGILFIFLFCACFRTRIKSHLILSIILFFMANTNVYALMIAISFGLTLIVDFISDKELLKTFSRRMLDLTFSFTIFIFGIVASVWQLNQHQDSTLSIWFDWSKLHSFSWIKMTLCASIWKSYVPVPSFLTFDSWNSNALIETQFSIGSIRVDGMDCAGFLSLALLLFSVFLLVRKPIALLFYILGTFGILLFTYLIYLGVMRHLGHLFVVFIVSLWISSHYKDSELFTRKIKDLTKLFDKYHNRFIILILFANLVAGIHAFTIDLYYPFSASKEVVIYLKDQNLENSFIVGNPDYSALLISALLNKKIYYLETDSLGSSIIRNSKRKKVEFSDLPGELLELTNKIDVDMLLILNYELQIKKDDEMEPLKFAWLSPEVSISQMKKFNQSIVPEENYYLYSIKQMKYPSLIRSIP